MGALTPLFTYPSRLSGLLSALTAHVSHITFALAVTGGAAKCGQDGEGYRLTLPIKWLVEHKKHIEDGMKVVKLLNAAGRLVGLPLPHSLCLPKELVSKAEAEAVAAVDLLMSSEAPPSPAASRKGLSAKAATGKAYKALRKLLDEQCHDKYLETCELRKVRASDGTIEFVSEQSAERFLQEGNGCLVRASCRACCRACCRTCRPYTLGLPPKV